MTFAYPVTEQIKTYFDADGTPLNGGYLYFGVANQNPVDNPVQMYWDSAATKPAAQPFRTVGGKIMRYGTPANVFAVGDFSALVKDAQGRTVYTVPNSTDLQLALSVTSATGVSVADAGLYFTGTNVEDVLQEVGAELESINTTVAALVPTGTCFSFCGTVAPTGYVLESGRTIGSALSGGTERANADTEALYTLLWNSSTNTELPIQDSAGTPTTRGASASLDFQANKRLPLPDGRGRVHAGKDNMGGSTAGRLTVATFLGTTQFNANGTTETHTLTAAQLAAHAHPMPHTHSITHGHPGSIADPHTHVQTQGGGGSIATAGSGAVGGATANTSTANTNTLTIANFTGNSGAESTANTSNNTGGGGAHNNVQPTIIYTRIIKL